MDCFQPYEIVTTPNVAVISHHYHHVGWGYGENLHCEVTIKYEERVSIVFEDFEVHKTKSCNADWLKVYDGDSSDSKMIGRKLCGQRKPKPMESTGNSMTLVFRSDAFAYVESGYMGFKIIASQKK